MCAFVFHSSSILWRVARVSSFLRKGQLNRHTGAKGSVESTHKVPTSHYSTVPQLSPSPSLPFACRSTFLATAFQWLFVTRLSIRSLRAPCGAATQQIAQPTRAPAGRGPTDARHSRRARAQSPWPPCGHRNTSTPEADVDRDGRSAEGCAARAPWTRRASFSFRCRCHAARPRVLLAPFPIRRASSP